MAVLQVEGCTDEWLGGLTPDQKISESFRLLLKGKIVTCCRRISQSTTQYEQEKLHIHNAEMDMSMCDFRFP